MTKTLRKIWKSDWGKAALLGVGMVGYGAASRAGAFTDTWLPETSDITNFLAPTKGSSGFLADVQQFGADIVTTPLKVGGAFAGSGYDYLIGESGSSYGKFKKELKGALPDIFPSGTKKLTPAELAQLAKMGYDISTGGGFGGGPRKKIQHRPSKISPIGPAGNIAIAQARQSRTFDPNRTAHSILAKAYGDRYYKDIDQQARGVQRFGPNINIKESGTLAMSKPSYRYTHS